VPEPTRRQGKGYHFAARSSKEEGIVRHHDILSCRTSRRLGLQTNGADASDIVQDGYRCSSGHDANLPCCAATRASPLMEVVQEPSIRHKRQERAEESERTTPIRTAVRLDQGEVPRLARGQSGVMAAI